MAHSCQSLSPWHEGVWYLKTVLSVIMACGVNPSLRSRRVGGFVEAMAKQQNKSKSEIEKECFEHVRPSSLLKRFATVDEIAAMATYLAGELFSATNGAALRADGGVVRAIL